MLQRYLDPQNPIAFKRLFGEERNKEMLLALLCEVLKKRIKAPLKEGYFLTPLQELEAHTQKQSIVDLHCRDEEGAQYIIEMHLAQKEEFQQGARYYTQKTLCNRMEKGESYEHVERVIFLTFCNASVSFRKRKNYAALRTILAKRIKEYDPQKFCFVFIDLPKFEQGNKKINKLSQEGKFCYFLLHAPDTTPEELAVLTWGDKVMEKAYQEIDRAHWSAEEMQRYEAAQQPIADNGSMGGYAREEGEERGRKKGKEEGIKEGKQEMTKQMLVEKEPLEKIKKYTELPSQWLARIKSGLKGWLH